ncbi:MAG: hypothetical protein HY908_34875 [Myxococcales bacterium]|nr:hypothetical protein [Myxococcales bacterium]
MATLADDGSWAERNRPVLRMAVMMGSTLQMTMIMVAALVGRIDVYLWTTLTLGNLWALGTLLFERRAAQKALRVVTPAPLPPNQPVPKG